MEKIRHYILLENSQIASKLYFLLKKHSIKIQIAPTPRNADHCCGLCIIYQQDDKEKIADLAKKNKIKIDQFWEDPVRDDPNRMKFC